MQLTTQAFLNGLMLASIYGLVALGLTLVFGLLDIVNFAHGQFLLLGAYLTYELSHRHLSFWLAATLAMVIVGVAGSIIEWGLFRRVKDSPISGLLISVGLISIFDNFAHVVWGPDPYKISPPTTYVLRIGDLYFPGGRLLVVVVTAVVLTALAVFLKRSKAGKAMRATAQNREAAALMGISVERISNGAFLVGCALAALAGALLGSVFPVEPVLAENPLLKGFIALIIGGAGSPLGAALGALAVGMSESMGASYLSAGAADIVAFGVLIAVLFFRPEGIMRVSGERGL